MPYSEMPSRSMTMLLLSLFSLKLFDALGLSQFPKAIDQRYSLRTSKPVTHYRLHQIPKRNIRTTPALSMIEKYGKGAEIFPPTNQFPLKLSDSFPGGILPTLRDNDESQKKIIPPYSFDDTSIGWIVSSSTKNADTIFITIAITLVGLGFIRPMDFVTVAFISGYTVLLSMIASSPRFEEKSLQTSPSDETDRTMSYIPVLSSLPPQGHLPSLFINPLGHGFTNSDSYRLWLRIGAIIGLIAPVIAVAYYFFIHRELMIAGAFARPLFYICCQSFHENALRRDITPLPLRILVPVMYNSVRLSPLYECMMLSSLESYGKIFAITSFLYWSAHLFGFLIPVGVMRYLRAHFFCVEAEEVKVHAGGKESIGLLP